MPDAAAVPPNTGAAAFLRSDGQHDLLVQEEPLLLWIHGQQLMTMRTPGRDEDLGLGFLLGEGIVQHTAEVLHITLQKGDPKAQQVDELRITLAGTPDAAMRGRLARTHEIRSSCGVCGLTDPQQILEGTPPLLPGVPKLERSMVATLVETLRQHQPLFAQTGGSHGALLAAADGSVLGHGEDVGRHNALDKAIGMASRAGHDLSHAIAVLSGRAGYDLVVKCLRVRVPVIIAVSAPSSLSFELCSAAGATLIGFARKNQFTTYCDSGRMRG
ncbi:MAG: formate dehydrogenase accessory sulfurtransferase FdhD [Planctomycetota bacterium]|nr:formate dehydrogenase accessory sulfurtransferase FdhD [Planctomycetota bacterium]